MYKIGSYKDNGSMKNLLLLLALSVLSPLAFADDIEFPEEELARESTLPVFSKQRAVLNRNIVTEKRFEFALGAGLEMNEPFYNDYLFSAQGTYNFNETSALNIHGLFWNSGLSDYGEQLKPGSPGKFDPFDADKAPHPTFGVFANYQFIAYYGKISITKQTVMNLNLFGLAGLGYLNLDPLHTVALNLGVGQNFFFTKRFGLRTDLRWIIYRGPDATSQSLKPTDNPEAGAFDERLYFNAQLGLSLVLIL